ncbi:hypothetical protein AMECASPLE_012760 [Ameca splendens]|uniref:Uncharacterized protein n=1 Tax=Ameca splendens TaxID=208324 RepID=A0ABV1A8H9_9TELE
MYLDVNFLKTLRPTVSSSSLHVLNQHYNSIYALECRPDFCSRKTMGTRPRSLLLCRRSGRVEKGRSSAEKSDAVFAAAASLPLSAPRRTHGASTSHHKHSAPPG